MSDAQQELLRNLFTASLTATSDLPGVGVTKGQLRCAAVLIGEYLGLEDGELLELIHLHPGDTVAGRLAMGYSASMMVNTGNKYGLVMIGNVLKSFSGEKVSPEVAELLEDLEKHIEGGSRPDKVKL